jgi:hypothetical protein
MMDPRILGPMSWPASDALMRSDSVSYADEKTANASGALCEPPEMLLSSLLGSCMDNPVGFSARPSMPYDVYEKLV